MTLTYYIAAIDSDDFVVSDSAPTKTSRKSKVNNAKKRKTSDDVPSSAIKTPSNASRFAFNPMKGNSSPLSSAVTPRLKTATTPLGKKDKQEARYSWLVDIMDADKNPRSYTTSSFHVTGISNNISVGHPDYDPRTLYIPPSAWAKFTPFEKQYWEIKCKLFDTVVFFKKVRDGITWDRGKLPISVLGEIL